MIGTSFEVGSVWRLKSGRLVEIEKSSRGDMLACFYVNSLGRPLVPARYNIVTLSKEFLESYGRRVRLDNAG